MYARAVPYCGVRSRAEYLRLLTSGVNLFKLPDADSISPRHVDSLFLMHVHAQEDSAKGRHSVHRTRSCTL